MDQAVRWSTSRRSARSGYEIKWDGYRVSAYLEAGKATIYTRNGDDWTHRFPAIAASVTALPLHSAVIDGEAVVLDDQGRSSFSALQATLGTSGRGAGQRRASAAVLYAFDLLFLNGYDMRDWSVTNRLAALETISGPKSPAILLNQGYNGSGADLFAVLAIKGWKVLCPSGEIYPTGPGVGTNG